MSDHIATTKQRETAADAWLLTREWRDKPQGIELVFWASSESGPIRIVIDHFKPVFFIDRSTPSPAAIERKQVQLNSLSGDAVDALYFKTQSSLLNYLEASPKTLCYETDLKPCDRFLMERFITGACVIQGTPVQRTGYTEYHNPRLSQSDYRPQLRVLSVDIETDYRSGEIISIASDYSGRGKHYQHLVVNHENETAAIEGATVEAVANEKALLTAFLTSLQQQDPDLIIGWNVVNFDLSTLEKRCQHYQLLFNAGRANSAATMLPQRQGMMNALARIPGRVALDGIECLRAAFWNFESFSLENVANELLGRGKLIQSADNKAEEILELYRKDLTRLLEYNLLDSVLVRDIFAKTQLIDFLIERAAATGLALGRSGGSVAAFDFLYLPRLHRKGYVANTAKPEQAGGLRSPGGYVMDSTPGLYNNVLVLDFKSLYPSIIRTFLIDPLGLNLTREDAVPGFEGALFAREANILPGLIRTLWEQRDAAKTNNNAPMSQAIKIIMNSFYGVLGASACRFYDPRLTSSITRRGHWILQQTRELIENDGYQVIYGDTDSVFVRLEGEQSAKSAEDHGLYLQNFLNRWWDEHIRENFRLQNYLELEFETHYRRFLMPTMRGSSAGSKKRYAGLTRVRGEDTLVVKGLESVRTDWTPLAREFQRKLFEKVFADQAVEQYIRGVVEDLYAGKFDDKLRYRKRIRQELSQYVKNIPPHIQAARKQAKSGRFVEYVITEQGPEPIGLVVSPLDYSHYIDKQLRPVADTILQFIDLRFDTIISGQMVLI